MHLAPDDVVQAIAAVRMPGQEVVGAEPQPDEAQAVTRLARSHAWRALGRADADGATRDAKARLDAIGITASGWERLFSAASGS